MSVKGNLNSAEAYNLANLVDYADDSVVSRTLHKNDHTTMTVFAFDKDQELSEHTAPFDAYVQVLDGEVELIIGGKSVPAKSGDIVLMPANVPHGLKAVEKFKMLLTMIRG